MSAQSAEQRRMAKQIFLMKRAIEKRDFDTFESHLAAAVSEDILVGIREQKIIFQLEPHELDRPVRILQKTGKRLLQAEDLKQFEAFLDFVRRSIGTRDELRSKLSKALNELPPLSISAIAVAARTTLEEFSTDLMSKHVVPANDETVANFEHRLHAISGALNDYAFAILRAINEAAKSKMRPSVGEANWKERDRTTKPFRRLVKVAGELNAIDFIIDSVSYDKFKIDTDMVAEPDHVTLRLADPRLDFVRTAGIRRGLVLNINNHRAKRFVREKLIGMQTAAISNAVWHLLNDVPDAVAPEELTTAIVLGDRMLVVVDAEDDLLYVAADNRLEVAGYYYAAIALRWYSAGRDLVEKKQKPRLRRLIAATPIPLHVISASFEDQEDQNLVASALTDMTTELPVRSHFELVRKPFVRDGRFHTFPLLPHDLGLWNLSVREKLVDGDHIGKSIGKIWEEFYAQSFSGTDLKVLGAGIRLREGKDVLTDVDLLLLRDDLLLVVQIKALTGSDVSQYDHWKNRKVIEWGCMQAKVAAEYLRHHPDKIISIANKAVAKQIKHIEPVVLTNSALFDGWIYEGVVVAGETIRKAITEGAKIEYRNAKTGAVIHTHDILRKEDLSTETIRWLLRNPIEFQALPELVPRLVPVKLGSMTYQVPDLSAERGEMRAQDHMVLATEAKNSG